MKPARRLGFPGGDLMMCTLNVMACVGDVFDEMLIPRFYGRGFKVSDFVKEGWIEGPWSSFFGFPTSVTYNVTFTSPLNAIPIKE